MKQKWKVCWSYVIILTYKEKFFISLRCPTRGPRAACDPGWLWMSPNTKSCIYLKPFVFAYQFSLVFVYLMCGPRQLFFFQCGPETPKGWTRLKPLLFVFSVSLPDVKLQTHTQQNVLFLFPLRHKLYRTSFFFLIHLRDPFTSITRCGFSSSNNIVFYLSELILVPTDRHLDSFQSFAFIKQYCD